MSQPVEISGKVVMKKFGEGSKSEHDAIYLETGDSSYLLRRQGGNPFNDPTLHSLVGKSVKATGFMNDNLFLANEVNESTDQ